MDFRLQATYAPTGDQPDAIRSLLHGYASGLDEQVLLGVTGSGKTFTMANVIASLKKPTLIISHNKTLAAQLFQEFREYFPENAVSYFVSYYDYYQPEAYIPQTDTYIEKETQINEEIDKLRLAATTNILTRADTIVIASVSSIYNIGSPVEYGHFVLELRKGMTVVRESILERLVQLQYERNDYGFKRATFRVRGDSIDVFPAYEDSSIRMVFDSHGIQDLYRIDPLTGKRSEDIGATVIYPAKHYMTDPSTHKEAFKAIRHDLDEQVTQFKKTNKLIEAQRIEQRVNYDLEMIQEMGYVNGIENYSRYFDGRKPGSAPYTLFDYFTKANQSNDWLLIIDESHMTIPQIRGMYNGDRSRKQTLIDFGFRLPSALDNRPLRFDEFLRRLPKTLYASATPDDWERERVLTASKDKDITPIAEQLIRPTGLVDPVVSMRPVEGQIDDLLSEIRIRVEKKQRVLVTTITKRMAEDLSQYIEDKGIRVHYLHADILTLERSDILADLRKGIYDVVVGVNLLREGLDLPEVSLVAILDADKQGFLRSKTSLIQIMGRAARHLESHVILYADKETDAIREAVKEVDRRRRVQTAYNKKHSITPAGISKPIRDRLVDENDSDTQRNAQSDEPSERDIASMTPFDKERLIKRLTGLMRQAGRDLRFEEAARLRDLIARLES